MGGGNYHEDVRSAQASLRRAPRSSAQTFTHSESGVKRIHPDLNPFGAIREAANSEEHPDTTPIVVMMDVTSSRGDDAKMIYQEVPKMLGAIQVHNLVSDPTISWVAVGDATTDLAPLQVSQFEADRRIDEQLAKIWMEEGGGGTGEESYELAAYFMARKTKLDASGKGYLFITGDEAPYPTVSKQFVRQYIGDDIPDDISTAEIFAELQQKFHVFLIFPQKSMDERRSSIDSEIQKRLEKAGGRFKDVSIRASLMWNDYNDLDLHCITPKGEHIFFSSKRASCGGELDVDRNAGKRETRKPVENIRWAQGRAPAGAYKFWVENYGYHENDRKAAIPFKVELDVDGEIQTFEGETAPGSTSASSKVSVFEFEYTPGQNKAANADNFAPYEDDVILGKWRNYIPESNIIRVANPAASVEVMLGLMSLQSGKMDLASFSHDMKDRDVSDERMAEVSTSLQQFANQGITSQVDDDIFA